MIKCKLNETSRTERLTELIRQQKWNHLTREQKAELKSAILDDHELFILDKSELGLMKGPPAKIHVADPQPSRGRRYRYPEEAKRLIADILQDMEDRQIIEKSTSAWLSPIVLVNKPNGSKRMCLDYRHAVAQWIRRRAWGRTDVDAWVRTPPVLL